MYITHLKISNIRGFRSGRRQVDLHLGRPSQTPAGWTVLAGRNGAGKTTILRAIALAVAGPAAARTLQETFAGWIRDGQVEGVVQVELSYDSDHDRFEKTGRLPRDRFSTGLRWLRSDGPEPALEAYSTAKTMKQTPDRGPWSEDPRGWFIAGYGPFRRLTGHASDAQRLMVGPNHVPRLVSLFREDASLLECVQWLKDIYLRRLEAKPGARELEAATIRLLNDGMLPDAMRIDSIDSDGLWMTQGGTKLPLTDLSDGYRTMIALVLDILRHMHKCYGALPISEGSDGQVQVNLPGLVLIDEIDVHLHVSWQQNVGFWLKKRFPKVQFIVTSHSPYVCQAADPGGLIRLPAPGEERVAEPVDDALHRRIIRGTADEAALSELFGLESTRSRDTDRLLQEFSRLEGRVIRRRASKDEEKRYRQLQLEFPSSASAPIQAALDALASRRSDETD